MNMVLSEVEETIYVVDPPQEGAVTAEPVIRQVKRQADMLFVRGDGGKPSPSQMGCLRKAEEPAELCPQVPSWLLRC
jgi:hypothetical protein